MGFVQYIIFFTWTLLLAPCVNAQQFDFSSLKGPYLGQPPPGMIAEIFAPGIISTEQNEHSYAAFSNDGKELFWSISGDQFNGNIVLYTKEENGKWTQPTILDETNKYNEGVPFLSLDGKRLYVSSDRPNRRRGDYNIWYYEREGNGWKGPQLMSFYPNTKENMEFFLCQTRDGSFYYTLNNIKTNSRLQFGLVKVPYINGKYHEPTSLGSQFNDGNLNWTPYVNPDESYLIFSSNRANPQAGVMGCDLYISFKSMNDSWTEPVNMGADINSKETIERFPIVSPDGKYLFFIRGYGDFYWVDAGIIEELREK